MRTLVLFICFSNFLFAQMSLKELNRKAVDYYQIQKYDSALYYFNQLIDFYPNDTIAYLDRALTKEMLNDYTGSIADYTRLEKVDSSEVDAYFLRGAAFYHLGFIDAALSDFKHFIISENDNSYAYYFIGKIFLDRNQNKTAKKYFEKAIFHNPMHSESLFELAKFEFEKKKYDSALKLIDKSIEAFPSSNAYRLKCILSYQRNNFYDAAISFENLAKYQPEELFKVISVCNKMKKTKQLNKFFLTVDSTKLHLKDVIILSVLKGDFFKVCEIFSKLPKKEQEIDFIIFLGQLAKQMAKKNV